MYVQSLMPGDKFTYGGCTVTVKSVTYEHAYTDTYVVLTKCGRKLHYYAGQQVESA